MSTTEKFRQLHVAISVTSALTGPTRQDAIFADRHGRKDDAAGRQPENWLQNGNKHDGHPRQLTK